MLIGSGSKCEGRSLSVEALLLLRRSKRFPVRAALDWSRSERMPRERRGKAGGGRSARRGVRWEGERGAVAIASAAAADARRCQIASVRRACGASRRVGLEAKTCTVIWADFSPLDRVRRRRHRPPAFLSSPAGRRGSSAGEESLK